MKLFLKTDTSKPILIDEETGHKLNCDCSDCHAHYGKVTR